MILGTFVEAPQVLNKISIMFLQYLPKAPIIKANLFQMCIFNYTFQIECTVINCTNLSVTIKYNKTQ